jgi:hypothetical protein
MVVEVIKAGAQGLIVELNGEKAQELENTGYLVIGVHEVPGGIGHLSTVRPAAEAYNEGVGPLLSNVGSRMGIVSTVDGFGSVRGWKAGEIKFYYDPNQNFRFDPSLIARRNPVWRRDE